MDNVELFELCETNPKEQCKKCFRNQSIVYCTCGHLLRENKSSRHLHRWQLDVFSIPNSVIKKERLRGAHHGKTEAQKEHFIAHDVRKRCIKRSVERNSRSRSERFKNRHAHLKADRTEEKCIEVDELAPKSFTYLPSTEEFEKRKKKTWSISLNTSGRNAPMKLRSDFSEAITKDAPSSPCVWRRATCTDSFLPISAMAFVVFFIQHIMVAVE